MLLYYLTTQIWGLSDLDNRHVKFSRFDDLNDPFELLSAHLGEKDARNFYKAMKAAVNERFAVICLSSTWQSPVMWAHYADKHKGLCLAFEVKEAAKVRYEPARLKHKLDETQSGVRIAADLMKIAMTTKFTEWHYEKEWRVFSDLKGRVPDERGNYFLGFGEGLLLREVIIGARCNLSTADIAAHLGHHDRGVRIRKVRPAFQRFAIVRQKQIPELVF